MNIVPNVVYDNYYYYKKFFMYKVSLYKKMIENYYNPTSFPWWNEIIDGIILGAIPLKNYKHDDILIQTENVKYILTILNTFEIETITYISQPVTPEHWVENDVIQKIINSNDFEPLRLDDIIKGVSFIEDSLGQMKNNNEDKKIYVHCKAGHGRSAIIVIAYLIKNHGMTPTDAHTFTKSKRSTINLRQAQYDTLVEYHSSIKNLTSNKNLQ